MSNVGDALEQAEPIIHHLLGRILPDLGPDDRDDTLQDLRLKLLEALPGHDAARGKWTTYAYQVARNAIIDRQRSRRAADKHKRVRTDPDTLAGDDEQDTHDLPEPHDVDLTRLTRRQATVYHVLARGGRRMDTARTIGVRPSSLSQMIQRIRTRLTGEMRKPIAA